MTKDVLTKQIHTSLKTKKIESKNDQGEKVESEFEEMQINQETMN